MKTTTTTSSSTTVARARELIADFAYEARRRFNFTDRPRAFLDLSNPMDPAIVFESPRTGSHQIWLCVSSEQRIVAHWQGFVDSQPGVR